MKSPDVALRTYKQVFQVTALLPNKQPCVFEDNRGLAAFGIALLYEQEKKEDEMIAWLQETLLYDPCEKALLKLAALYEAGTAVAKDSARAEVYRQQAQRRSVKMMVIPMPVGPTEKVPIEFYIGREFADGRTPLEECNRELEYLRDKGVYLPPDVNDSLKKLWDIAVENKVEFVDLITYALNYKTNNEPKRLPDVPSLANQLQGVEKARAAYTAKHSDANRLAVADKLGEAAFAAIFERRYTDAIKWSREALKLVADTGPAADPKWKAELVFIYGNLAHALLFQGKYSEALTIYKEHWEKPMQNRKFKDAVLEDFAMFDRAGLTHPDMARVKKDFGIEETLTPPKQ